MLKTPAVRIMVRGHGSPDTVSTQARLAQNVSVKLWYACKTWNTVSGVVSPKSKDGAEIHEGRGRRPVLTEK